MTLLLFILILAPLCALLLQIPFPGFFWGGRSFAGLGALLGIFQNRLWRVSLDNSLMLAFGSATFGTVIGGLLAMLRTFWNFPTRRLLDLAAWVLLITPSFILAQGWVLFSGNDGVLAQWFGIHWVSSFVFSRVGLMCIMTLSKYPLAYLAVSAALEWNVVNFEDAARLCGAKTLQVWRSVHIPLLIPSFVAGWALVFMEVIGDFGLPSALATAYRFPTLPYSIYTAIYQTPTQYDEAGVLALYLILLISLALCVVFYALKRARYDFLNSRAVVMKPRTTRVPYLLTSINVLFLILVLGIPIGTSLLISFMRNLNMSLTGHWFGIVNYVDILSSSFQLGQGLRNSLVIAGSAALASLVVGFLVSYVLVFTRFTFKPFIEMTSLVSLAVPGVVLGIGYIFIWNEKWLVPLHLDLYGTPWILVLAAIATAIPYSVRLQIGAFSKIPTNMLSAVALQGGGRWRQMRDVVVPLVRNSLLVAGLASFGTCMFDLAISVTLVPPDMNLLPIEINGAFQQLQYGYSTAATMVGCGLVVAIILIIHGLFKAAFAWSDRRKERRIA